MLSRTYVLAAFNRRTCRNISGPWFQWTLANVCAILADRSEMWGRWVKMRAKEMSNHERNITKCAQVSRTLSDRTSSFEYFMFCKKVNLNSTGVLDVERSAEICCSVYIPLYIYILLLTLTPRNKSAYRKREALSRTRF